MQFAAVIAIPVFFLFFSSRRIYEYQETKKREGEKSQ